MTTPAGTAPLDCRCYACGDAHPATDMQPFGANCFGEPVTWVCTDCAGIAIAAPHPQPHLATTASR